jgi:hypothetical protein
MAAEVNIPVNVKDLEYVKGRLKLFNPKLLRCLFKLDLD